MQRTESTSEKQKEDKEQNRPAKNKKKTKNRIDQRKTKRRQRTESTSEIQPQKKTKNRIDQRNMTNYNVRGQRRYRTRKAAARGHNQNADLRNSAPIRKNYCATRLICLRARSSCILSTNPLAEFHAAPPFSVSSIG